MTRNAWKSKWEKAPKLTKTLKITKIESCRTTLNHLLDIVRRHTSLVSGIDIWKTSWSMLMDSTSTLISASSLGKSPMILRPIWHLRLEFTVSWLRRWEEPLVRTTRSLSRNSSNRSFIWETGWNTCLTWCCWCATLEFPTLHMKIIKEC